MRLAKNILLAGLVLWLSSCHYSENGIYFAEPVPGNPPEFNVSVNLDTLADPVVSDSIEVRYEVEIENGEFYLMEAYLADTWLNGSDSVQYSFWLQHDDVPFPGPDTLYLFFYYSTNTTSLADLIGLEAIAARRSYGIIFH